MKNQRYYIALLVGFLLIAAVVVYGVRTNVDDQASGPDEGRDNAMAMEKDPAQSVSGKPEKKEKSLEKEETAPKNNVVVSTSAYQKPIEGALLMGYGQGLLSYSKTLDQFVAHMGIDIEGVLDEPVYAAQEGVVSKVTEDDQMGTSIWIAHPGNITTKYANLSTVLMVEEGDAVKKGDVISGVGNTSLLESLDPIHLHLEVEKDGKTVNPLDYFHYQ